MLACAPSAWASVSVSVMPPSGVHAGVAFSGQVAAFTDSDPSDTAQSWVNRVNVDWGDRSPPVAGQMSGGDGSFVIGAAHTYSAAGTYTITVSVYAGGAQPTSASAPVTVASIGSPIAVVGRHLRAGMPLSLKAGTAGAARYAWDLNGDGRADATCGPSQPVVTTIVSAGRHLIG